VRAYALLVRALELQGRRDQALRATETFLARFPNDAQTPAFQLTRGQLLVAERRWDAAQKAFEAARDRRDAAVAAPAQYWLGEALRAQDQHEAAVASYLGATYLYPSTPWAARGLQGAAESYLARKMGREAGIVLRKLAAIPGADPAVAQWARQVLAQLGPAAAEDGRRLLPRPDPGKP
jgi:TolA-binding protein